MYCNTYWDGVAADRCVVEAGLIGPPLVAVAGFLLVAPVVEFVVEGEEFAAWSAAAPTVVTPHNGESGL